MDYLLAHGADPRLTNKDGANASVIALQKGSPTSPRPSTRTPGGKPAVAAERHAHARPRSRRAARRNSPPTRPTPPPNPAEAREQTWLKEQGVKPADVLKHDTGQDDDHDGFTNDEELAAGTDPNDPKSHPPYYTKLRLRRIEGEAFPVVFEGSTNKGAKATLSVHEKGNDEGAPGRGGSRQPRSPECRTASNGCARATSRKRTPAARWTCPN